MGEVSVPVEAVLEGPTIQWNHVDGPLMHWAGLMHWLTFGEISAIVFRRRSKMDVGRKRFPSVARAYDNLFEIDPTSNKYWRTRSY